MDFYGPLLPRSGDCSNLAVVDQEEILKWVVPVPGCLHLIFQGHIIFPWNTIYFICNLWRSHDC